MYKATSFFRRLTLLLPLLVTSGCAASEGGIPSTLLSGAQEPQSKGQAAPGKEGAIRMAKVDVSYSLAKNQFTLHEPVLLELTMKNGLPEPVEVDLGTDRKQGLQFTVRQPDGKTVQPPQWRREGISRIGRLMLESGQIYRQEILLDEWYEFPAPGKYELSVRMTAPIKTLQGESAGEPAEFRATVEIRSRDTDHLKQVAAKIVEQINGAASYEEAAQAAEVLSHINDPVAVPYMEKALASDHMVESILIGGLEKIGNEEAVRVLTSASSNPNGDVAELARAALDRLNAKPRRGEH